MTGRNKAGRGKAGSTRKGGKPQAKRPHATIDGKAENVSKDVSNVALGAAAAKEIKERASSKTSKNKKSKPSASTANVKTETSDKREKKRSRLLPLAVVGVLGGALALFGGQYLNTNMGFPSNGTQGSSQASKTPQKIPQAKGVTQESVPQESKAPHVDTKLAASKTTGQVEQLTRQIEALQTKLTALEAAQKHASQDKSDVKLDEASAKKIVDLEALVGTLSAKTADLETKLSDLQTVAQTNKGAASRVESLEKTLKTLSQNGAGDSNGQPTSLALATRVNELENSLKEKLAAVETSVRQTTGENGAVSKLESKLAQSTETTKGMQEAIDSLTKTSSEVDGKLKTIDEALSQQSSSIKAIEGQVTALSGAAIKQEGLEQAIVPLREKLGGLEKGLSKVEGAQAASAQNAKRSALTIAMAALKREIDAGRPYEDSLKAVKSLAPDALDFSSLEPFADTGLVSQAQLVKNYSSLANEASAADVQTQAAEGSIWDKVKASAKSVIKLRTKGDIKGDSNEAVIARVENQLKKGDGNAALKEAQALTGKAKEIMAPWLEKLKARLGVGQSLAALEGKIFEGFEAKAPAQ